MIFGHKEKRVRSDKEKALIYLKTAEIPALLTGSESIRDIQEFIQWVENAPEFLQNTLRCSKYNSVWLWLFEHSRVILSEILPLNGIPLMDQLIARYKCIIADGEISLLIEAADNGAILSMRMLGSMLISQIQSDPVRATDLLRLWESKVQHYTSLYLALAHLLTAQIYEVTLLTKATDQLIEITTKMLTHYLSAIKLLPFSKAHMIQYFGYDYKKACENEQVFKGGHIRSIENKVADILKQMARANMDVDIYAIHREVDCYIDTLQPYLTELTTIRPYRSERIAFSVEQFTVSLLRDCSSPLFDQPIFEPIYAQCRNKC